MMMIGFRNSSFNIFSSCYVYLFTIHNCVYAQNFKKKKRYHTQLVMIFYHLLDGLKQASYQFVALRLFILIYNKHVLPASIIVWITIIFWNIKIVIIFFKYFFPHFFGQTLFYTHTWNWEVLIKAWSRLYKYF